MLCCASVLNVESSCFRPYVVVTKKNGRQYLRRYERHIETGLTAVEALEWQYRKIYGELPTKFEPLFSIK